VLFAAWALGGLYLALGPALARLVVHNGSNLVGGVIVFIMAASAATTVLLARNTAAEKMMAGGIVALIVGVALTLVAFTLSSVVAFALSLVLAGAGFGTTLQGAIRTVLPAAGEHQRAGLLSLVYVVSYLGMGLPAVIAGFLVVYGGGLRATAVQYGLVVMALAAVALVGLKKTQPARNLSRS
jgi:MFS family permease